MSYMDHFRLCEKHNWRSFDHQGICFAIVKQLEELVLEVNEFMKQNGEEEYLLKAVEEAACIRRFMLRFQANLFVVAESLFFEFEQWRANQAGCGGLNG